MHADSRTAVIRMTAVYCPGGRIKLMEIADPVRYAPLYLQVRDKILQRIVEGRQEAGSSIPTEQALAKTYGTSTSTIRQAINLLVAEGVLIKRQGKGTFLTERKTTISFLSWIAETSRGREILVELIRRFEQKNPAIAVSLIPTTFTDTRAELVRMISSGKAPDVAQIVSPWTTYFASMSALAPLDQYLGRENIAARFPDKDLCGGTYNGRLYSVAWGLCPLALIANPRVLQEAGVTLDSGELELERFADICRRVSTQTGRYAYGLNVRHDETDFLRLYPFLQAFGGEFVDDAGQVVFNCPENVEGFRWLKDFLQNSRIFTGDIYSIRDRFARDEIAFRTDGPWIKYILEELTGEQFDSRFLVVPNPSRPGRRPLTWNYNHALAISAQSRNKYHAGLFIDQVTNDPELSDFYFSATGHLHSNRSRLEDPVFTGEFFRAFRSQLAGAKCINAQNPMFEKAMVLTMDAVKRILFEGVDVARELNEKEHYLTMLYYG
jgi:ABC-type glycerol-3-phosphate transport system substrate-binding protein